MEEIKTKKKLNKKPLIICLVLALVFGIVGFIDIKSNAAESTENENVVSVIEELKIYKDGVYKYSYGGSIYKYSTSGSFAIYTVETFEITDFLQTSTFVVSDSTITYLGNTNKPCSSFTDNYGKTWYYFMIFDYTKDGGNSYAYEYFVTVEGSVEKYNLNTYYDENAFISVFSSNSLDIVKPPLDYDNLPIDDDMPCVSEIKRNYIINHYSSPGEEGITQPSDTYEYLIWVNSSDLPIQLEVIPVVQYYKTLFGKSDFLEEYIGEWREFELLDSGTTKYLRQTDDASLLEKYNEDYQFKKTCLSERSVNIFTETAYFFYGYRVRYVDIENEKAGPWTVVMPSQIVNESEKWQEYSDGSVSNSSNSSGEVSDTNYGDVDKNLEEIEENINFKDKYEVVDGNADTQEVMNWLNTVVSFIKGTPNIVTSVLSFLPQPILYGMYITIFLGCIASAIAIIKALI